MTFLARNFKKSTIPCPALRRAQVTKLAVSFDSADRKKLQSSFGISCEGARRGQEGSGMGMGIAIFDNGYTVYMLYVSSRYNIHMFDIHS
jgi:hypothetical protein